MYKVIIRCSSAFGIFEEKSDLTLEQAHELIDQWGDMDTVDESTDKLERLDGDFYAIGPFIEASIELEDEEQYTEEDHLEELRLSHIYSWYQD